MRSEDSGNVSRIREGRGNEEKGKKEERKRQNLAFVCFFLGGWVGKL